MRNTGLDEAQAGIKITRRNIKNLRYEDDITLMAESEEELKMYKMGFEEAEKSEIKLPTFVGSWRKQSSSRNKSTFASLTMPKPLTVWITTNCRQFLKRWEYQTILLVF